LQKHREDLRRAFEHTTSAHAQPEVVVENGVTPPQQFRSNNAPASAAGTQGQEPIYENVPLPWLTDGRETAAGDGEIRYLK